MNYPEALQRLFSRNEFSIKLGLRNIRRLLQLMGNPQNRFPAVHIAGTNGKGSVASFTASVLQASGTKTALYTSPHLIDFRERIRVNGRRISKKEVLDGLARIDRLIQKENRKRKNFIPTYFEVVTALAFDTFARRKVEVAVLETGLGGRLDATNACRPLATIITHIDQDHQAYLGNSLSSIALEKAGILKRKTPLITAERKKEIVRLFQRLALPKNVPLIQVPNHAGHFVSNSLEEETFDYAGEKWLLPDLKIQLLGTHQIENAMTALRALEELEKKGFSIPENAVRVGLKKTCWPGRFQWVPGQPGLILDGAHNSDAVQTLLNTLHAKKMKRPVFIFGMMKDKEIRKCLRLLSKVSRTFYLVEAKVPRAASVFLLEKELKRLRPKCKIYPVGDLGAALALARRSHRSDGSVLCLCGSLYLVGESLNILGLHAN